MNTRTPRLLLTGIGGFIGHHVAQWILDRTDWIVVGVDSWHPLHKGDRTRISPELQAYEAKGRLKLHKADMTVPFSDVWGNLLYEVVEERALVDQFDYVLNLASDSHVTRSITDPARCWLNNTQLILNMLELFRGPNYSLPNMLPFKFLHISTDEVYGDAGWDGPGHPEWATIMPSNPYSASKAAQEALCIAYWRTYDMPIMITNTMNVIGERQDPEKFLPKVIQKILHGETVEIHGDSPERIAKRVWLDAKNMADALRFILEEVDPPMYRQGEGASCPGRFNIVGETELNVLDLAGKVADQMGKPLYTRHVRGDQVRPGYDRRYALDGSKLASLGWTPPFTFEQTLSRVIEWTLQHPEWTVQRKKLAGA